MRQQQQKQESFIIQYQENLKINGKHESFKYVQGKADTQ